MSIHKWNRDKVPQGIWSKTIIDMSGSYSYCDPPATVMTNLERTVTEDARGTLSVIYRAECYIAGVETDSREIQKSIVLLDKSCNGPVALAHCVGLLNSTIEMLEQLRDAITECHDEAALLERINEAPMPVEVESNAVRNE